MMNLTCEIGAHSPDKIVVVEGSTPAKVLVFSRRQVIITLCL